MKYTVPTIAKSLMAVVTATLGAAALAAHGADLSVLTLGDWMGALGAGLGSGGLVFATPNQNHAAPAEQVQAGVQAAAAGVTAAQATLDTALAEADKVKAIVSGAEDAVKTFGPLTNLLINAGR